MVNDSPLKTVKSFAGYFNVILVIFHLYQLNK